LLGRRFVRRGERERLRRLARRFRQMAADMGGVMIKVGQFLSTRADIMPPEIIEELRGLQDEAPPVPFEPLRQMLEADLGPIEQNFAWLNPEPQAAASLGQVHRAQLLSGERVVVKIQRPNITDLVATDLAALQIVAGWLMRWQAVSRRADVPALMKEFGDF
jgi:predicted unusual protein kinase regulating ubiquinone biosynthesis (AarF/ABC1/UbiB family)